MRSRVPVEPAMASPAELLRAASVAAHVEREMITVLRSPKFECHDNRLLVVIALNELIPRMTRQRMDQQVAPKKQTNGQAERSGHSAEQR